MKILLSTLLVSCIGLACSESTGNDCRDHCHEVYSAQMYYTYADGSYDALLQARRNASGCNCDDYDFHDLDYLK